MPYVTGRSSKRLYLCNISIYALKKCLCHKSIDALRCIKAKDVQIDCSTRAFDAHLVRSHSRAGDGFQVCLPVRVDITLRATVQGRPLGLLLEETHSLDVLWPAVSKKPNLRCETTHVLIICRKPMVDPSRKNDQIILTQPNPYPLILLPTHIKVPLPISNVPNLLVLVQMFTKERLHLLLVDIAHSLRRDADLVAVLVAALGGQGVDKVNCWAVAVEDADGLEVGLGDGAAGVVRQALVALLTVSFNSRERSMRNFSGNECG